MSKTPLQHLQEVLRNKGTERLTGHYGIKMRTHPDYPNLHQFKYNQLESPMGSLVVQACRGIVLDSDNDWEAVCHVFNKFFNEPEGHAAPVDWETAKVFEKLDGSLIQLYYYDNEWRMTTSGSPDGGGSVGDFGFTFKELFWKTWVELGYDEPIHTNFSYAFELCTKYNRIVVNHEKPRIVLLGARNNTFNGEETTDSVIQSQNWECVKSFDLSDLESLTETFEDMSPYSQEGYVVVDKNFNRVKVKSPAYVAIHHVVGSLSKRNILQIIRMREESEFLAHFPEWRQMFEDIGEIYQNLLLEAFHKWEEVKDIEVQKDFALAIKDLPLNGALFQLRSGKIDSIKEFTKNMNIKSLEEMLGLKND